MHKGSVLIWLLVVFSPLNLMAEDAVSDSIAAWDTTVVDYRVPTADTINYYKSLEEYSYDQVQIEINWWEKFLQWLSKWFTDSVGDMNWFAYLLLAGAVFILVFFIFKLYGVPVKGLFVFSGTRSVTNLAFSQSNNSIDDENLEKNLKLFISSQAFREATRILYLLCLRVLNKKQLIDWRPWKTDREYFHELSDSDFNVEFKELMLAYEYVWFGCFEPDGAGFEQLKSRFDTFTSSLNTSGRGKG